MSSRRMTFHVCLPALKVSHLKVRIQLLLIFGFLLTLLPPAAYAKETIYFGAIPRYNPMIMYKNYQPIMDYLNQTTPYHFELKLARNYLEAVEHLRNGVTQVASLGDVTFATASLSFGAQPILRPKNKAGNPHYYSLIIVRHDSTLTDISQLRDKTFAFGSLQSTSGNFIPRAYLEQQGVKLDDLKSYTNLATHTDVARAVLKRQYDAGAVKDVVAYRYEAFGLRILGKSEPIPSVPITVRKDAPSDLVNAITDALLSIDPTDPDHQRMLAEWDPEFRHGFVPASIDDYRSILQTLSGELGGPQ